MLGLFDSGRGGLNTVRYLKESKDDLDLIYLIDTENSPYGIKTEKEITEITKQNINNNFTNYSHYKNIINELNFID